MGHHKAVITVIVGSDGAGNGLPVGRLEIGAVELKELQRIGTRAAILGKALYTGRLDLKTVIAEVGAC